MLFVALSVSINSSLDHHQSLASHYTHLLGTFTETAPQLTKTHLSHFHLLSLQERIQRLQTLTATYAQPTLTHDDDVMTEEALGRVSREEWRREVCMARDPQV